VGLATLEKFTSIQPYRVAILVFLLLSNNLIQEEAELRKEEARPCDVLLLNKLLLVVVDVLQLHTPLRTYSYDLELIILRTYSLKKSEHRYCCHTHTTYESNSTDLYFEHSVVFLKL
jgi:hypothetical protein